MRAGINIAVIGAGYVGLVSGKCFADWGNKFVCVDQDARKIERLSGGMLPIYQPSLEALVKRNQTAGTLSLAIDRVQTVFVKLAQQDVRPIAPFPFAKG